MNPDAIDKLTNSCSRIFADKKGFELPEEYRYSHLPLCVIDAVFSIGVRYEGVKNTITRFCNYFNIEKQLPTDELSTTDILNLIKTVSRQDLTDSVFRNHQRTSSRNGILKSDATINFLEILHKFKVERFKDVRSIIDDRNFENEIKRIPGQHSGISLSYFFMLTGSDNLIKPDRMIIRFLESITNEKVSLDDCLIIIQEVVKQLNTKEFKLTPRKLDYLIWDFQRTGKIIDDCPPKTITIYEQIKELLHNRSGSILSSSQIKAELKSIYGTNPGSVILSDYCYNRYNDGIKFDKHIFEYCEHNKYLYLGENVPYNGNIIHNPEKKGKEIIVGEWENGKLKWFDPNKSKNIK